MKILKNWKILWILIILLLLVITMLIKDKNAKAINSFEECAQKYPVLEIYPRQCITPDGKLFIEDISDDNTTVCTMEARECPDGSWVGRTGPNCEFASCSEN